MSLLVPTLPLVALPKNHGETIAAPHITSDCLNLLFFVSRSSTGSKFSVPVEPGMWKLCVSLTAEGERKLFSQMTSLTKGGKCTLRDAIWNAVWTLWQQNIYHQPFLLYPPGEAAFDPFSGTSSAIIGTTAEWKLVPNCVDLKRHWNRLKAGFRRGQVVQIGTDRFILEILKKGSFHDWWREKQFVTDLGKNGGVSCVKKFNK